MVIFGAFMTLTFETPTVAITPNTAWLDQVPFCISRSPVFASVPFNVRFGFPYNQICQGGGCAIFNIYLLIGGMTQLVFEGNMAPVITSRQFSLLA